MQRAPLKLEVITPQGVLFSRDATSVIVPTESGSMGILPGHAPLIGNLKPGIVKIRDIERKEMQTFVSNGFIMVSLEGVTILADSAETEGNIDIERAMAAKERAEKRLTEKSDETDMQRAKEALLRAEWRLHLADKN
jgi:F-type H+-transporting ATPase subunit epsilon